MTLTIRSQTREQWLEAAVTKLRPLFAEIDVDLPAVRVSVGWPSKGGTRSKGKVIGQCWKSTVATDGIPQLFISPILGGDAMEDAKLIGVLCHELIHAWDDCESGHRGAFAKTAKALGLEGKMTATTVGDDLLRRITEIQRELGAYPHAALRFEEMEKVAGKQTTRMLKCECPEHGYIVRTTAKWLDELGAPRCPCGQEMEPA